ncbi:hypothetical protein quinque_009017 [Culex quinquefasciatus]
MDISIKPVFSFSLNYKVFEKLVTCGKYDGIHSCLTVVTNADKILIHTPHKRYGLQNSKLSVSEIKNDIAMLNMNSSYSGHNRWQAQERTTSGIFSSLGVHLTFLHIT